jgi:hypothetical protein
MDCTFRKPIQHNAIFFANRDVSFAREFENLFQFSRMCFPRNVNAFDRNSA